MSEKLHRASSRRAAVSQLLQWRETGQQSKQEGWAERRLQACGQCVHDRA